MRKASSRRQTLVGLAHRDQGSGEGGSSYLTLELYRITIYRISEISTGPLAVITSGEVGAAKRCSGRRGRPVFGRSALGRGAWDVACSGTSLRDAECCARYCFAIRGAAPLPQLLKFHKERFFLYNLHTQKIEVLTPCPFRAPASSKS